MTDRLITHDGFGILLNSTGPGVLLWRGTSIPDPLVMLSDPSLFVIGLIDIETSQGEVNISSDSVNREIGGKNYSGFGGLLSIDSVDSALGVESRRFSLTLSRADTVIQNAVLQENLSDKDIRMSLAISTARADAPQESKNFLQENVIPLILGKVSNALIEDAVIAIEIYTPMADGAGQVNIPTRWSDEQQVQLVDPTDRFFRFASSTAEREVQL